MKSVETAGMADATRLTNAGHGRASWRPAGES